MNIVSMDHRRKKYSSGFTLIELLVVIAIVAVLISLCVPALAKTRTQSYRFGCLANCKLMAQGASLFSNDDSQKAFVGTINYADDDVNWLFPNYIPDINVFHCPATRQVFTNDAVLIFPGTHSPIELDTGSGLHLVGVQGPNLTPNDTGIATLYRDRIHGKTTMTKSLDENAHGRDAAYGSSYEVAGFMNEYTRKTEGNLTGYKYTGDESQNKIYIIGQLASISDIWITYDEDDAISGNPNLSHDDYPDAGDNHGTAGGNVSFADGHAAWVKRSDYALSHAKGTDQPYTIVNPP